MPDTDTNVATDRPAVAWLAGFESEIEPLSSGWGSLLRVRPLSASQARATALRLAREHRGLAVVEASCPAFPAVCHILARSPAITLVTIHPATRGMGAVTLPPWVEHQSR